MSRKLREAEETLRAMRDGEVDAIVVSHPDGDRVYALKGADEAYRLMIQNMAEGALTVAPDGLILFSNERLASMLAIPHERMIGSCFHEFIVPEDACIFSVLLARELSDGAKLEVRLKAAGGALIPVSLAVNHLTLDGIGCFCVIVADLTEQKRSEEVLRALSARLLQVQDNDRHRIARGLHDGSFQRLAALEFKLRLVAHASSKLPPAARGNLTECLALVDKCCRDLSELAYLIHPPLLEEQGLGPALQAHVNGLNRRLGLNVSFHVPSRLGRLPADVEITSFRVAEEALSNIVRHSGSPTARIHLRKKAGKLLIEVADRGCGIPKELLKKLNRGTALPGIGIAGMQERVRLLGGLMEIDSRSDGTTVRAKLPIRRPRVGHPSRLPRIYAQ